MLGYARKTKYGWTLVLQQDAEEAYAPLTQANRNALALLALTLVFVGLVSFFLAQQFKHQVLSSLNGNAGRPASRA